MYPPFLLILSRGGGLLFDIKILYLYNLIIFEKGGVSKTHREMIK